MTRGFRRGFSFIDSGCVYMANDKKSEDVAAVKTPAKDKKVSSATKATVDKSTDLRKAAANDLGKALKSAESWYEATGDAGARRVFNILKSAEISV